jgi:phosphatidylserine decarboxylase
VPNDPDAILSPADGTVLHAGPAPRRRPRQARGSRSRFSSRLFDVHINRTPAAGRITRVTHVPGTFLPAFRPDAHRNEHSEIWIDRRGIMVVFRQVVGVLARRVVTRVKAGDTLEPGARIGLMKFGSRMDVFLPVDAVVVARTGEKVRAGETVIARLPTQDSR